MANPYAKYARWVRGCLKHENIGGRRPPTYAWCLYMTKRNIEVLARDARGTNEIRKRLLDHIRPVAKFVASVEQGHWSVPS